MQVNLLHKSADQGCPGRQAGYRGHGGLSQPWRDAAPVWEHARLAFAQVPVYSNLDGYQLFPHWTATVGGSYAFAPVNPLSTRF